MPTQLLSPRHAGAPNARRARVLSLAWLAPLLLAACGTGDIAKAPAAGRGTGAVPTVSASASTAPASGSGASAGAEPAGADEASVNVPFHVSALEPYVTRQGQDRFGRYYTVVTKITYAIQGNQLRRLELDDEPPQRAEDVFSQDVEGQAQYQCTDKGAAWNEATLWYPYTGIFVHGGQLSAVRQAKGGSRTLHALDGTGDDGDLHVTNEAQPFTFVPCVGAQRVRTGHRTQGFLQSGDVLSIAVAGQRQALQLRLPTDPQPYAVLEHANDELAVTPARIVLATVDVPRKRVVLQYQVSVATNAGVTTLRLMETATPATWRTLRSDASESDGGLRAFDRVVKQHLSRCARAASPTADACAKADVKLTKQLYGALH